MAVLPGEALCDHNWGTRSCRLARPPWNPPCDPAHDHRRGRHRGHRLDQKASGASFLTSFCKRHPSNKAELRSAH
ncbi:MAG: hypothetical protein WBW48_02130, partial [Anaerolineae bacterium]